MGRPARLDRRDDDTPRFVEARALRILRAARPPMRTPITPRVTLPPRSSSSRLRTVLIGTANPTPALDRRSLMIAVFIPITSPRMFRSGPPELPGLIAASVCSISLVRPLAAQSGRLIAEMMPTVTVWLRANGAPMAITQSPRRHLAGVAERGDRQLPLRLLDELDQRAVGQSVAPEHARLVTLGGIVAEEVDLDGRGVLDHVVVRQDQAGAVDHEAGSGGRPGRVTVVVLARVPGRGPAAARRTGGRTRPPRRNCACRPVAAAAGSRW